MKSTLRTWTTWVAMSLALAGGAHASDGAPINRRTGLVEAPLTDLRKAAERGNRAELARVTARMGSARIAKALQDPDRRNVLAALDGIPLLDSGILLLEEVLPLLASPDEAIRDHALGAASALLAASSADRLADWEIASETMRATCRTLANLAANEGEALSARLQAVQGLADAPAGCVDARYPADLLTSREPEIRRAALIALLPNSARASVLVAAARDRDASVAAAAGARLCERQEIDHAVLADPAVPPLRTLALAKGALPEDVIGILPCLATSSDPADAKTMDVLKNSGTQVVRKAAANLTDKTHGRAGIE